MTQTFCELHPADPSCITPEFCSLNPTDPACVTQQAFCTLHPSDPACTGFTDSNTTNIVNLIDNIFGDDGLGGLLDKMEILIIDQLVPKISKILKDPIGDAATKLVVATGAILGTVFNFSTLLFSNPIAISEALLIPTRIWSLILTAFGLRKRTRPWGTVYDSVTKQPLDPAYVVLQDLEGKEVATCITDLDGRYGFLVQTGSYRLLANKTNYEFPSKKLVGRTKDELYQDLYFNEIIEIKEGDVITKNIPMDPLKFDWNEFAKRSQKRMKFFSRRLVWVARISDILFWTGFILSTLAILITPSNYNAIIFIIYIVLFVFKRTILRPRPSGSVKYKESHEPLSFAIMHIFFAGSDHEVTHKVTDRTGRYYCLVPNGIYYVKIESKNADESYSLVYTTDPIEVKNGYINSNIEV